MKKETYDKYTLLTYKLYSLNTRKSHYEEFLEGKFICLNEGFLLVSPDSFKKDMDRSIDVPVEYIKRWVMSEIETIKKEIAKVNDEMESL